MTRKRQTTSITDRKEQKSLKRDRERQTDSEKSQKERSWCDASAINFITCKQKRAAIFICAWDYAV